MSQCFAMKHLENSMFIKFSIASRWVKNTSSLVETDPPIQIALVCFFPTSKKVPLLNNVRLETQKIRFL